MGIVVIGAVFVDIKGYPEGLFIPNGRNAGRVEQIHGGVGRNVVEDVANCELRPTFVSLVDQSGMGEDVIRRLKNHRINTDYIRKTKDGMGTWLAVFNNEGDVVASISKRPDLSPIAKILEEQGDEIFSNADSIIIEIDVDKEIVKRTFKLAKKYNKPVYAVVANMSIALERRDFLTNVDCFVCNRQEAELLFSADFSQLGPNEMAEVIMKKISAAGFRKMIVTLGGDGAVYADWNGEYGWCPARRVKVKDTTGAGDSFCAGVAIGLTYGKTLAESAEIGAHLAASVVTTSESVCPRFQPREIGLNMDVPK